MLYCQNFQVCRKLLRVGINLLFYSMKKIVITTVFIGLSIISFAQTNSNTRYQSGYYKPSTGSYVQPHMKTESNNTNHDNYSTKGNSNSYTGESGYRAKDYSSDANSYGSGKIIHTGSKGGQYYYNSNGNKTYVPKQKGY